MLLGLEQYLFERTAEHAARDQSMHASEDSGAETDPAGLWRDTPRMPDAPSLHGAAGPPLGASPNGLMSLLSGSQTRKRRRGARKQKAAAADSKGVAAMGSRDAVGWDGPDGSDGSNGSDGSDAPDTSFDAGGFERSAAKARAIEDLERRVFSAGRAVSVADFLTKAPPLPAPRPRDARGTVAPPAPRRQQKASGEWCLDVRLKVPPARLAALREPVGPARAPASVSVASALVRRRPEAHVTLRLPTPVLQRLARAMDPLYTECSGTRGGKSARGVFAMMMRSASHAAPRLTAIQRLRGLHPPPVPRGAMHVVPQAHEQRVLRAPPRVPKAPTGPCAGRPGGSMAELVPEHGHAVGRSAAVRPRLRYTALGPHDAAQLIRRNAPLAFTSAPHMDVLARFIQGDGPPPGHLNWPQKFQPKLIETLLLAGDARRFLKRWMANAFAVLETQSTKVPRNVRLKEQQRKQRKRELLMLSFVASDREEDGASTDEDIFVPILVIQGDSGSCKSACVYAAMAAMDGYVHEINTGQARSKRDIHSSLREFCTSHIIGQKHDEKRFQKGLVLFEDCDILFEQDKTFWAMVQEVINYSRRPVVVTVKDISVIPRNILELAEEQNAVLCLKTPPSDDIRQYLWLCAYSENVSVSPEVLDFILHDCETRSGTDLRKSLMSCQWLCRVKTPVSGTAEILFDPQPRQQPCTDLDAIAKKLDTVSVADIIEANTPSSILHDVQINELLDIYLIDDSVHLRQRTLPHELNTGLLIKELFEQEEEPPHTRPLSFNEIKTTVLDFISSRARKIPKFIQELYGIRVQTRSRSSSDFLEDAPETQGLPESSVCYSMSPQAFIQDLAPVTRYWASFQKGIVALDEQSIRQNRRGLLDFLGWRKFHDLVEEVLATGPFSQDQEPAKN